MWAACGSCASSARNHRSCDSAHPRMRALSRAEMGPASTFRPAGCEDGRCRWPAKMACGVIPARTCLDGVRGLPLLAARRTFTTGFRRDPDLRRRSHQSRARPPDLFSLAEPRACRPAEREKDRELRFSYVPRTGPHPDGNAERRTATLLGFGGGRGIRTDV